MSINEVESRFKEDREEGEIAAVRISQTGYEEDWICHEDRQADTHSPRFPCSAWRWCGTTHPGEAERKAFNVWLCKDDFKSKCHVCIDTDAWGLAPHLNTNLRWAWTHPCGTPSGPHSAYSGSHLACLKKHTHFKKTDGLENVLKMR